MGWFDKKKTDWNEKVSKFTHSDKKMGTMYGVEKKKGSIDHNNHVHFHGDGATITKNGEKYTMKKVGDHYEKVNNRTYKK